jgi:hypothetical protein
VFRSPLACAGDHGDQALVVIPAIVAGAVVGLALFVVAAAAAVQFADMNLFQEKDAP